MDYKVLLQDLLGRLTSRKFLLVFGMMLLIIASDNFGLKLDPEIRKELVVLTVAYLAAEGTPDAIRAYKQ